MLKVWLTRHDATNQFTGSFYKPGQILVRVTYPSGMIEEGNFWAVLRSLKQHYFGRR